MNVAAPDQHKQYDASVPKFLHNRPKTVVQHCMRRWFNAENSTLEDVDQVSSSQFLVKSLSDFKTALCYEVCFENDSGMPSCQCLDWINNHLPCKHFMAVFHHLIPETDKNNPYICLDVESFPLDSQEDPSGFNDEDVLELHISNNEGDEYYIESLPIPPRQTIKKERTKICNLLEIIKMRCYESDNLHLLEKISETLTSVASDLVKDLPKECNFVLDKHPDTTHIGTNQTKRKKRKVFKTTENIHWLPLAKKRKLQWSGRHGVAAQKKRTSYLKEGVNKLIG